MPQEGDVYQHVVRITGPGSPGDLWPVVLCVGRDKGIQFSVAGSNLVAWYEPLGPTAVAGDGVAGQALHAIRDAPPGTLASQLRQMAREALRE